MRGRGNLRPISPSLQCDSSGLKNDDVSDCVQTLGETWADAMGDERSTTGAAAAELRPTEVLMTDCWPAGIVSDQTASKTSSTSLAVLACAWT